MFPLFQRVRVELVSRCGALRTWNVQSCSLERHGFIIGITPWEYRAGIQEILDSSVDEYEKATSIMTYSMHYLAQPTMCSDEHLEEETKGFVSILF